MQALHPSPAQAVNKGDMSGCFSLACLAQFAPVMNIPLHPLSMQCLLRAPLLVLVVVTETLDPETETVSSFFYSSKRAAASPSSSKALISMTSDS
jgi:hypothetical protein